MTPCYQRSCPPTVSFGESAIRTHPNPPPPHSLPHCVSERRFPPTCLYPQLSIRGFQLYSLKGTPSPPTPSFSSSSVPPHFSSPPWNYFYLAYFPPSLCIKLYLYVVFLQNLQLSIFPNRCLYHPNVIFPSINTKQLVFQRNLFYIHAPHTHHWWPEAKISPYVKLYVPEYFLFPSFALCESLNEKIIANMLKAAATESKSDSLLPSPWN